MERLIYSPDAPLRQAYSTYKIRWLAGNKLEIPACQAPAPALRGKLPERALKSEPMFHMTISIEDFFANSWGVG